VRMDLEVQMLQQTKEGCWWMAKEEGERHLFEALIELQLWLSDHPTNRLSLRLHLNARLEFALSSEASLRPTAWCWSASSKCCCLPKQ